MKSFAKLIDKLPFAGKLTIHPVIFGLYQSTTKEERRSSYLQILGLLILFILFHVLQVNMGIKALEFNAPVWVKVVSALYAIANTCIVLTQIYLVFRTTRFYFCAPLPRMMREYAGYSDVQAVTMIAVTLGGQIIFLSLYYWFR
jgi:hypothetical protein